jgi:DNA polymerase-3 subunit beta
MLEAETVTGTALKISVPREELTRQLAVVSRAASTRTTVQVLAGILLRAGEGKLELAATDMEISIRSSLEAQVDGDGAVEDLLREALKLLAVTHV